MRYEDVAEFAGLLIRAMRDLAARCEQPDDQEQNTKTLADVPDLLGLQTLVLCGEGGRDVVADCATRLQETAGERGISYVVDFADRAGTENRDAPVTWRELQLAQAAHDRACNPARRPSRRGSRCCATRCGSPPSPETSPTTSWSSLWRTREGRR